MILQFLKQEWKFLLIFITVICVGAGYYEYKQNQNVPIQTIADTSPLSIAQAKLDMGIFRNFNNAKDVSKAIQQRIEKPANIVYYTNNQQDADKKANQIAKSDDADYILKQTSTNINTNTGNNTSINDGRIINNYYGVHTEKNNSIAIGATVVDNQAYASIEYTHKDLSVEFHSKDLKNVDGITVKKVIKKW